MSCYYPRAQIVSVEVVLTLPKLSRGLSTSIARLAVVVEGKNEILFILVVVKFSYSLLSSMTIHKLAGQYF